MRRDPAVPVLSATPLVLRPFSEQDLEFAVEASRDPFIPKITTLPADATDEQGRAWIATQRRRVTEGLGFPFVITDEGSGAPLGQIGLWRHKVGPGRASIGYWVLARHRRRGIACCALRAVATWGASLPDVERLELSVEP